MLEGHGADGDIFLHDGPSGGAERDSPDGGDDDNSPPAPEDRYTGGGAGDDDEVILVGYDDDPDIPIDGGGDVGGSPPFPGSPSSPSRGGSGAGGKGGGVQKEEENAIAFSSFAFWRASTASVLAQAVFMRGLCARQRESAELYFCASRPADLRCELTVLLVACAVTGGRATISRSFPTTSKRIAK